MSEETANQGNDIIERMDNIIEMKMNIAAQETALKIVNFRDNIENSLYALSKEIGEYARSVLDKGKPLDLGTIYEIQMMVEHVAMEISKMQL